MTIFDQIISIYNQFISIFPVNIQWIISLVIFIVVVKWTIDLVKQNIIWLILLIILLPASIPILQSVFDGLLLNSNFKCTSL